MPKTMRAVAPTGIQTLDEFIEGGLPVGAITELVGPECSGRSSSALSFVSRITQAGKVCAWIDVSDTLDPESAASVGVDLSRLLWVRCGVAKAKEVQTSTATFALAEKYLVPAPIKKGLHGGGFGPHPRSEVRGLSSAVSDLLRADALAPRCAEPQRRIREEQEIFEPGKLQMAHSSATAKRGKPWSRLDQALRVTDLLLQAGGFSAVVLDMGSIEPEFVSRVPLATWFRYRAAAERTQASILLLTQYPCAKSSAGLVLQLEAGRALQDETTLFTGMEYRVQVVRQRFSRTATNVIPLRKPPQRAAHASWKSRTAWVGRR